MLGLGILVACGSDGGLPTGPVVDLDVDADGVEVPDDCDDRDPTTFPGADELCDDVDHDCDGDPTAGAVDGATWFADADGDGWGGTETVEACDAPPGFLAESGDCDDTDPFAFPGALDLPGDGIDSDCAD
ncbi:MAG: MopE-related protein, partial [Myxococcota bacterium]